MSAPVLSIEGLSVDLQGPPRPVNVVDDIALTVAPSETLALVGESGCGKSVTALSIMGLLDAPLVRSAGRITLAGERLDGLDEIGLQRVRGARIGMIFQEPMTALNPVFTIGEQIAEGLRLHLGLTGGALAARVVELLVAVGIADAAAVAERYPHELSGGMRQRAMIAMAIGCEPLLLIADEPTTALDVTVQAQILRLLRDLRERRGIGVLLITHNLAVVAHHADRVAIMYAGRIVEEAPVQDLFRAPRHPYTRALLQALPGRTPGAVLATVPGVVPDPRKFAPGCRFFGRCDRATVDCELQVPVLEPVAGDAHRAACWHLEPAG